jgi:hypothetical protein
MVNPPKVEDLLEIEEVSAALSKLERERSLARPLRFFRRSNLRADGDVLMRL